MISHDVMSSVRGLRPFAVGLPLLFVISVRIATAGDIDIGGLILSVSDSWTAQVFHIVDQLSEWDQYCHKQYGRWAARVLSLDREDRELLEKHAALRRARGWNNGFEQAFYVNDSIEVASSKAVQQKLLSLEEANAEKVILLHFSPKLSLLRDAPQLARFKERLAVEATRLVPMTRKLLRFSETEGTMTLPLFLIANPEEGNGGGGVNGGRLVVEVQDQPDPIPSLFHESLHALLLRHKGAIEVAAKSAGLSFTALNEGIAYALSPGITDDILRSDSVAESLTRSLRNGKSWPDSYVQGWVVALVIRPVLRSALDRNETFTEFLPQAIAQWRKAAGR